MSSPPRRFAVTRCSQADRACVSRLNLRLERRMGRRPAIRYRIRKPLSEQAREEHGAQAGLELVRPSLGPRADRLARLVEHADQRVAEITHLILQR